MEGLLEEAKRLSGEQVFVVRWISGVVSAQLPGFFDRRQAARQDLDWCVQNADKAPHIAWLREAHYQLARLSRAEGDMQAAHDQLHRSGYADFDRPITLTTPFSEDRAVGHAFSPQRVAEILSGKVYVLSGFEFTEYYFVVSDDGHELIGIDAGTRPDSAKAAYEALRTYAPSLPTLTTILVNPCPLGSRRRTQLLPRPESLPQFYARANYSEEMLQELKAPGVFFKNFFGERFSLEDVRGFKPEVTIERQTELRIGGTRIAFIPIAGGETPDALLIHLPDHGVIFVGDFIMPYLGAPFVEEGNVQGLLDAIDIVAERNPPHLLHGHEPLTRVFSSPAMLANLKGDLIWLRDEVLAAARRGEERAAIQQANLPPRGFSPATRMCTCPISCYARTSSIASTTSMSVIGSRTCRASIT